MSRGPVADEGVWFAFHAENAEEAEIAARRIERYARDHRHERDGVNAITVLRDAQRFYFSPLAARAFAPLVELYRATAVFPSGRPRLAGHGAQFSWRAARWGDAKPSPRDPGQ